MLRLHMYELITPEVEIPGISVLAVPPATYKLLLLPSANT